MKKTLLLLLLSGMAAADVGHQVAPGVWRYQAPGPVPPSSPALLRTPVDGPASSGRVQPIFQRTADGLRVHVESGAADLYGTGEVTGPLRRNGRAIELWNHDNFRYRDYGGRRLYQSHPWVLGVRPDGSAFGVLFDTSWRSQLHTHAQSIDFSSAAPAYSVYVIEQSSPQKVLRSLADLTGKMPLPPRWAIGYHQCRYSYAPDSEVRRVAQEFRKRRIPCDVMWMDIDYMDGYRIFTFDPKGFPDPKQLNDDLHAWQFKSIWMIDPGVKKDPGYSVFDSGNAHDVWVKTHAGEPYVGKVWPGECQFPDFTSAAVREWWAELYRPFAALGVDGVWNDMNEPAVFEGVDKSMPMNNQHAAGAHIQCHNIYGMMMVRATRDGMQRANPDKRPFVLTRANFLGGHRYAATWTGDNASTWDHLRQSVPMSLNLGLSGQPFNGPDLGGFDGVAQADLWGNWVGSGAFFPFCRAHASKGMPPKEPWCFGPKVENAARIALLRRYRLLPYLYTLFERSSRLGDAVMTPVFFLDPKDPSLRREQQAFALGPDLVVVPAWAKQPHLPRGRLVPLQLVEGDGGPYQARLLQRAGSIVPLGAPVQNTEQESLAPLTLSVVPDAAGNARGELYWDAGDGFGASRRSTFRWDGQSVREVAHSGDAPPAWKKLSVSFPEGR